MKNNEMPLVSIVVPHYGKNDVYLAECLNSYSKQTYTNFELLLIDNGSLPSELARELCRADSRFKYFYVAGAGMCGGRNFGANCATGQYICYGDSDDYVLPDYLEELVHIVAFFNLPLGFVRPTHFIPKLGRALNFTLSDAAARRYIKHYTNQMLFDEPLTPWAVIVRADLAKQTPFDIDHPYIFEEAHWGFRLLLSHRDIAVSEKHLYVYRHVEGSVSATRDPDALKQRAFSNLWRIADQLQLLERYEGAKLPPRFYQYFSNVAMVQLIESYQDKRPLPRSYRKQCLAFIRENKSCFQRKILLKAKFGLTFPRLAALLFKRHAIPPKV